MSCAVAARGLGKRFGRVVALRGIDLDVPEGHCLAVLGPNGAGKSTLLRLVAGLARPSEGGVEIGGRPALDPASRARLGYIGHATLLYPSLSARENLIFAGRLQGLPDAAERADRLLAEEGLAGVAERRAGGFSRGMAQRLAIARGLVHDPRLVLLDEPFTGLDRRSAERLAERLLRLRSEGRTALLVSHDVDLALRCADSALVLSRGRLAAASADPAEVSAALDRALAQADGA